MKRDMELIRKILFDLEERKEKDFVGYYNLEGYSTDEVEYHLELMVEKGLLKGKFVYADGRMLFSSLKISWEGHDFLDSIKNDTIWKMIKDSLKEKGLELGQVSFEILKEFIKIKMKQKLGLIE